MSDRIFTRPDSRSKCRRLLPQDRAALRFLRELEEHRRWLVQSKFSGLNWLLPFRHDFRALSAAKPCEGLRIYAKSCKPDDPALPLALCLLGRTASRLKAYELEKADAEKNAVARRHFAKAPSRVGLWVRLRQLAGDYPDDRFVQAMNSCPQKEDFAERLGRFARRVDDSRTAEAAQVSNMRL